MKTKQGKTKIISIIFLWILLALVVGFGGKAFLQNVANDYNKTCVSEITRSVEMKEVKKSTFFTEYTEYYVLFENGKTGIIYGKMVAEYKDGQDYKMTTCRAADPFVEKIEQ